MSIAMHLPTEMLSRKSASTTTGPLGLRLVCGKELDEAAQVVGRGMRDNPGNMRVFRIPNGEHRSTAMGRFFVPVLKGLHQRGLVLGGVLENRLVGICGMARPGFCQPGAIAKARILPATVIGNSITTPLRILNWVREWARRDPLEPHWHLGPVAVEPYLQGQGIGTAMLNAFCAVVDGTGSHAYLETDKRENVRLYQRFGFIVVESTEVLGVPNWFMWRAAKAKVETMEFALQKNLEEALQIQHASDSGDVSLCGEIGWQDETERRKS